MHVLWTEQIFQTKEATLYTRGLVRLPSLIYPFALRFPLNFNVPSGEKERSHVLLSFFQRKLRLEPCVVRGLRADSQTI